MKIYILVCWSIPTIYISIVEHYSSINLITNLFFMIIVDFIEIGSNMALNGVRMSHLLHVTYYIFALSDEVDLSVYNNLSSLKEVTF